jgi:RNA polymerase sigma factor (TIGR02999 family)
MESLAGSVNGGQQTRDQLVETVYKELKRLARSYMRRERFGHTLQPTALVHEAYLRLAEQEEIVWRGREHFIGVAATMMRRILVNHAVKKKRNKRGAGAVVFSFDEFEGIIKGEEIDLIDLDAALIKLSKDYPQAGRIVELKFFGGLSIKEMSQILEISDTTVERSWRFARAWLQLELNG